MNPNITAGSIYVSESPADVLRRHLGEVKIADPFAIGDVIRWRDRGHYVYAAVKTPRGWFTTSASPHALPKVLDTYDALFEVLSSSSVDEIRVARVWDEV